MIEVNDPILFRAVEDTKTIQRLEKVIANQLVQLSAIRLELAKAHEQRVDAQRLVAQVVGQLAECRVQRKSLQDQMRAYKRVHFGHHYGTPGTLNCDPL